MRQLKKQGDAELSQRLQRCGRGAGELTGADAVARELDELNAKHQRLLDLLYERLRRIAAANPGDIVTLVSFFYNVNCLWWSRGGDLSKWIF